MDTPKELAELAAGQAGAISRAQLLAGGRSDEWVKARLSSGRWQRIFTGTYATFSGPVRFETRVSAAVLRAGPGAMARCRTAAALDGLIQATLDAPIELLLPHTRRVQVEPAIRVRYSEHAAARCHPLRRPARTWIEDTVLDLAEASPSLTDVAGWVTRANGRFITSPDRLLAALQDRKRHRWRRELEAMLADVAQGAHSPLELRYLHRVEAAHGLPRAVRQRAVRQVEMGGRTRRFLDVDYIDFATRVELDGRIGHDDEGAFRDRNRDNAGVRAGQATLRYGWGEVFGTPCQVAAEVAGVLRSRGWAGQPRRCGPACGLD